MAQDIDTDLVRKLAELLKETGLSELEYSTQDWRVRVALPVGPAVSAQPAPVTDRSGATATLAPQAPETPPATDHSGALRSPMVGTAYLAPDPESPPFVTVGSTVSEGQTVMIIEAMKIMNTIAAHRSGTVTSIPVESGQPIEFDQILLTIE